MVQWMEGAGGKGEHTKCAVPEHHQRWLLNESLKTQVPEGRWKKWECSPICGYCFFSWFSLPDLFFPSVPQ